MICNCSMFVLLASKIQILAAMHAKKNPLKLFSFYSAKSEISKVYGLCSDYYDGPNSKLLVWGRQFWGLHQNDDYYLTTYYYTRRATLSQSDWENQGIYIISICDVNSTHSFQLNVNAVMITTSLSSDSKLDFISFYRCSLHNVSRSIT